MPASGGVSADGVGPAAEDRIDWLTAAVSLKPKVRRYADWLSAAEDAIN